MSSEGGYRALVNWAGWIVGSALITAAFYEYYGLAAGLGVAGIWVIVTGFGYHAIGLIRGIEAHIDPDDESDIHDERWKDAKR